jgi:hypothetical protein
MNQSPILSLLMLQLRSGGLVALWVAMLPVFTLRAVGDDKPLHPELERLRPLIGKTWRGEFKNSTPEKPVVDVARWERVLNGQAIRVLHSINDGEYGGETLIFWSDDKKSLAYLYVTTAGFQTSGTMTFDGATFTSAEKVSGTSGGITEVRANGQLRADGSLFIKSEYLRSGQWVPGRETVYREAPDAQVLFK